LLVEKLKVVTFQRLRKMWWNYA